MSPSSRTVTVAPRERGDAVRRTAGDEGLATAARDLVAVFAPALGLAPDSVRVHIGESGRRARAHGARGLTEGRHVFLAPGAFDPASGAGRALLAHELSHVAQQRPNRPAPRADAATDVEADVEAEARALAGAAAEGRPLWRPVALLPPGARAADTGAVGTLNRPAPPPAGTTARTAEQQEEVDIGLLTSELGRIVDRRYHAARDELVDKLSGWWVSAGDVRSCLRLLDTMPFLLARAVVRSLPEKRRTDLARNLENEHHRGYPGPALAALSALGPYLLRTLEAANVEGIDPTGLGPTARRAAVQVLQRVRPAVLTELLNGDRSRFFHDLMKGPLPPGTDLTALRDLVNREQGEEEAGRLLLDEPDVKRRLAEARRLLADPSGRDAVQAVEELAALAQPPPPARIGAGPAAPTGGPEAVAGAGPVAGRPDPPDPGPRLRYAVRALDRDGLVDRLLAALPDTERRADGEHAGKLVAVLAGREPYRTLILVESLLSYSAFFSIDWVITDAEARFAYLLVRSLPLDMQDRWKRWEEGKWFARLEENIPDEDKLEGRYAGIGTGADPFDPSLRGQLLRDVTGTVGKIDRACQGEISGAHAVELVRMVLMLGQPETGRGRTGTARPRSTVEARRVMLAAAVRRLDALGHLDRILEALPDAYLMHEQWRGELMEIFAARDPRHIERHARKLLETGFFVDWAVTAREAFIVAQMIGNLSSADQERFKAADPDRWAKIQGEMTPEMRASLSQTNIGGRVAVETRERLRDRLRDHRVWHGRRAVELRSLLIQLFAVNDRAWAFRRSREVRAYAIPGLAELVRDLHLYHPQDQPDFEPEQLRSTRFWQEGPFQVLGDLARYALVGLEMLWLALPSLFTRTVRVKGANVAHFEWAMGGDLAGARLLDEADVRREDEERRRTGAPEPNRLSLSVTPYAGYLTLRLPRLELSGMSRAWPGGSLRTGRVTLTGLDVVAHFSDPGYHTPVGAKATFDRAVVNDAVLAAESLPGGLAGVTRLGIDALALKSGGKGTEDLSERERDGWVGVPVIGPLVQVLSNILYLYGGLPGLSNISDMALAPLTAGTPYLARKFTNFIAGEIFSQLANSAIGLVTDGVFRPPRGVADRMGDAAAMLRALSVSFDAVTVEGLSFAGIQQVERVEVGRTFLGLGRSLPTQLRAEQASLRLRLRRPGVDTAERADLQGRLDEVGRQLADLEPVEDVLDRLEARHRWDESALSPAERRRVAELSRRLRRTGGGALDIEGIRVVGLTGLVETAGVEIGPIHAETATQTRWGEYLTDEELVRRFQTEKPPRDAREALRGTRASATVGAVRLLGPPAGPGPSGAPGQVGESGQVGEPGQVGAAGRPRLRLNIGRPPTVPEAQALLRKLPVEPGTAERRATLTWWTTRPAPNRPSPLDRLWALESTDPELTGFLGRPTDNPRGAVREQELQLLRERARRDFGLSVGDLSISGVTVRLDPETLQAQLDVAELEATDIRYAGYTVRRLSGEHVGTSVPPEISAEGGTTYRDLVPGVAQVSVVGVESPARLRAGTLTLEGVEGPGLSVQRLSVTGLSGSVAWVGDEIRIPDLAIAGAEVQGLSYRSPGRTIFATGTTRLGRTSAEIDISTVRDEAGNRTVGAALVRSLRIDRVDADHVGMDVTSPEPGYRVEAVSGGLVGVWVRDLAIDMSGTNLPVTGSLGIEQLDQLRVEVLSRVFQGAPTTITGTFGSPEVAAGGPASAVAVNLDYLVSGGQRVDVTRIDLAKVALTEGELGIGGNRIAIRRADLSGRVTTLSGGAVILEGLHSDEIVVKGIDWRTPDGATITARGSSTLIGVDFNGRWESTPDRKVDGDKVERGRARFSLDRLHVDRITSDNLSYLDGEVQLHLGRFGRARPDLLDIHDVNVYGLEWERAQGAESGQVTAGTVSTGEAEVEVAGQLQAEKIRQRGRTRTRIQDALFVGASVSAQAISLRFGADGHISTRARGVGGDIGVGATREAMDQHLAFSGLDTGLVDVRPDGIDIGPDGAAPLTLKTITVDGLDWPGDPISLRLKQDTGYLTLSGIEARARIELHPKGHPGGRFKRLLLRALTVRQIAGKGLVVGLPGGAAFGLSDGTDEAVLDNLRLLPPPGGEGFEIAADETRKGMSVKGRIDLAAFRLPWVSLDIGRHLEAHADISAAGEKTGGVTRPALTVDFFGAHGLKLSLRQPRIQNISATLENDPRRRLFAILPSGFTGEQAGGVGAKEITYEDTTDPAGNRRRLVTIKGAEISGVFYVDDRFGLRVFVKKATAPKDITHNIAKGHGELPQLDVEDASIIVDLRTLLGSGGGSSRTFRTATAILSNWQDLISGLAPYREIIDHLDGRLDFDVKHKDDSYPVRATFVDGALDYERLGSNLFPAVPAVRPYWRMNDGTLSLRIELRPWVKAILGGVAGAKGVIGGELADVELLRWDLPAGEVGPARKDHLVRLMRLVEPPLASRERFATLVELLQDAMDALPGPGNPSQRFGITNISGRNLSVKNPREIFLPFGAGPSFVVLAPNAVVGLDFAGTIEGTGATGTNLAGKLQAVSLTSATVARSQLVFDGLSGRTTVHTGKLEVSGIDNCSLAFDGLTPTFLKAHITKALAENITWAFPGGTP